MIIKHVDEPRFYQLTKTYYDDQTADVAILMTCDHRKEFVVLAINSALMQDYQNVLLVCVGPADDEAHAYLQGLADPRWVYIEVDGKWEDKVNVGLEYINTLPNIKFVTRLDDDDMLALDKVRRCRDYLLSHPRTGIVHHGYTSIDEKSRTKEIIKPVFNEEELEEVSNIIDGTIMARKSAIKDSYLRTDLSGVPFYEWFLRLRKEYGVKIDLIDYQGYYYRQHSSNLYKRVDMNKAYEQIRAIHSLTPASHGCDVLIDCTWLGRDSGITTSVKHAKAVLEKAGYKTKINMHSKSSLYSLKFRAQLLKPKVIIIEKFEMPIEEFLMFRQSVDWPCTIMLREHAKNSFSPNFWGMTLMHEKGIEMSKYDDRFNAASVNLEYARLLSELYNINVQYLPNCFEKSLLRTKTSSREPDQRVNISLLCEVRPLKNLITQISACQLIGKRLREEGRELHVHMLNSIHDNSFINNLKSTPDKLFFTLETHDWMTFEENSELVSKMDLCLQVSYTETMNYYALEHMSYGIPAITSEAIHFGFHAPIDDAKAIADLASDILLDYKGHSNKATAEFKKVTEELNKQFIKVINSCMKN